MWLLRCCGCVMYFSLIYLLLIKSANACIVEESTTSNGLNYKLEPSLLTSLELHEEKRPLTVLYSCNVRNHISGKTYLEIKNFLHVYIINKKNMHPNEECRMECEDFTKTRTYSCGRNKWCKNQPPCTNIRQCQFKNAKMNVCLGNMAKNNRRYEFIETDSKTLGNKSECNPKNLFHLETQSRGLFDICHYCFCICDEGSTPKSNIFISLRTSMSDVRNNKVVTGLRFILYDRIIHLQVQEAELLPMGRIKPDTIRWVPIPRFKKNDNNIFEGKDYHKLTWEHRSLHLGHVLANNESVVTGVRFRKVGSNSRLHLEILVTRFSFSTGKLVNPKSSTTYKIHPNTGFINKFGRELKLIEPNIPTRVYNVEYVTNKFIKFTTSSYTADDGQSTVPFFDAQEVATARPLSGIGLFHKGARGSGGFIAPFIFPYEIQ